MFRGRIGRISAFSRSGGKKWVWRSYDAVDIFPTGCAFRNSRNVVTFQPHICATTPPWTRWCVVTPKTVLCLCPTKLR